MDDVTAGLRIFVWYNDDDVEMKYPVYYLRRTMDFGDGVASVILTISSEENCSTFVQVCHVSQDNYQPSVC